MSQFIVWPIFFACVRAAMQWLGGFLFAGGYISQSQDTTVVGAGAFVAGLLWSIWQKVLANQRLAAAHAAAAPPAAPANPPQP